MPGFVVLLHLDKPLDRVGEFIIVGDLVMDVAQEDQVVVPVAILVRLVWLDESLCQTFVEKV